MDDATAQEDYMSHLLSPQGAIAQIGPETEEASEGGIPLFRSPHGSWRYVLFSKGEAVGALQIVSIRERTGIVAGVYTAPSRRRSGIATTLYRRALVDFDSIEQAVHVTDDGAAWAQAVRTTSA